MFWLGFLFGVPMGLAVAGWIWVVPVLLRWRRQQRLQRAIEEELRQVAEEQETERMIRDAWVK